MWPSSEETVRLAQAAGGGTTVSHVDGAAAALSSPAALQLLPRWQVRVRAQVSEQTAEMLTVILMCQDAPFGGPGLQSLTAEH